MGIGGRIKNYWCFPKIFVYVCTILQTGQPEVPLQRSGNPGYLDGLPILAGSMSEGYPFLQVLACHTHCILRLSLENMC